MVGGRRAERLRLRDRPVRARLAERTGPPARRGRQDPREVKDEETVRRRRRGRPVARRRSGVGAGKAHRLVGARASTSPRTTRCSRRSRSSRTRPASRSSCRSTPSQDMIPKTVAALDAGTPPDVAYADVYDFQVTGKWAFDGKLEDISDIIDADQGPVRAEHDRDDVPLQRQDQEEGLLRLPDEAADDAHPVLEGHAGGGGLQGNRHPERLEGLLGLLVRQGAAGATARRPASASSRSASRWASIRATRSIRS